jgi:hypothetical protein
MITTAETESGSHYDSLLSKGKVVSTEPRHEPAPSLKAVVLDNP